MVLVFAASLVVYYFSIAGMEHRYQKQLMEERVSLAHDSRGRVRNGGGGTAAGRPDGQSRKLRDHMFYHIQKVESHLGARRGSDLSGAAPRMCFHWQCGPSQRFPSQGHQVFKYLSLWSHFSLRPPRVVPSLLNWDSEGLGFILA